MAVFRGEKIWWLLTNVWTFIYFAFLLNEFFSANKYSFLVVPLSFLYIGILSVYVSTKEFDRWYDLRKANHPGEWFVALWTVAIFLLFFASVYFEQPFKLADETVAVYIAVLSIFAVTQRSKMLHRESHRRRAEEPEEEEKLEIIELNEENNAGNNQITR